MIVIEGMPDGSIVARLRASVRIHPGSQTPSGTLWGSFNRE